MECNHTVYLEGDEIFQAQTANALVKSQTSSGRAYYHNQPLQLFISVFNFITIITLYLIGVLNVL